MEVHCCPKGYDGFISSSDPLPNHVNLVREKVESITLTGNLPGFIGSIGFLKDWQFSKLVIRHFTSKVSPRV